MGRCIWEPLHLLGRGSVVINTGGEKVFPEEVEEVLKQHPSVRDAVAVGLPDDRFGETVCAIVEAAPGATVDEDAVIEHVRGDTAGPEDAEALGKKSGEIIRPVMLQRAAGVAQAH